MHGRGTVEAAAYSHASCIQSVGQGSAVAASRHNSCDSNPRCEFIAKNGQAWDSLELLPEPVVQPSFAAVDFIPLRGDKFQSRQQPGNARKVQRAGLIAVRQQRRNASRPVP